MSIEPPLYLQKKVYKARQDRQFIGDIFKSGVVSLADLKVTASVATRGVVVASGTAYIAGTQSPSSQGTYRLNSDSSDTFVIQPASTFPRVDQIIARVADSGESGTIDAGSIQVVQGVEASGASLSNRTGAVSDGALPPNWIRLADVLAPVGSSLLTSAEIKDRRSVTTSGRLVSGTRADRLLIEPSPGLVWYETDFDMVWVMVAGVWRFNDGLISGTKAARVALSMTGIARLEWYETDTGDWFFYDGSGWVFDRSTAKVRANTATTASSTSTLNVAIGTLTSLGVATFSKPGSGLPRLAVNRDGSYDFSAEISASGSWDRIVLLKVATDGVTTTDITGVSSGSVATQPSHLAVSDYPLLNGEGFALKVYPISGTISYTMSGSRARRVSP